MALKTKKKSLADKINSLVTTTPITFNSDDETEETKAKVVDRYDESDDSEKNFQISEIRKRNVTTLDHIDKRYKGKKVSRKDVYNNDDDLDLYNTSDDEEDEEMNIKDESDNNISDGNDDNDDDNGDDDDSENIEDEDSNNSIEDEEGNTESDNSDEEFSYDSEINFKQYFKDADKKPDIGDESIDDEATLAEKKTKFQTMSYTNVKAEIDKGNCVRSQLKLWESLLEVRIKLQKCLTASNQMPQYDVYKDLKTDAEYTKKVDEVKSRLKVLLNNMLQMQSFLLKQYPETKNLFTQNKKRKAEESLDKMLKSVDDSMDEEIPSDTEDENESKHIVTSDKDNDDFNDHLFRKKLKHNNYEKILDENHKFYTDYRNSVIQKWNDKTKIATGKLSKAANETTLKQIEFALSDKEKLRKKSRLKRSEYKIIGKTETADDNEGRRVQEYDCEIYDDDDFYHQLLRDLIEYKSSDITDPIQLSKQWIQLQNMRNKMKRKIDTRATKGRRIRYNVHNKLVNFMAPITVNDTWTDHAKDELYNSLFGKIKPTNGEIER